VDTTQLNYTYPDFNGIDLGNPGAVKTAISNRVNQLYGSSMFSGNSSFLALPQSIPAAVSTAKQVPAPAPGAVHEQALPASAVSTAQKLPAPTHAAHERALPVHVSSADTTKDAHAPKPSAAHNPPPPAQHHSLTSQVIDHLQKLVPFHHDHSSHPVVGQHTSSMPPNRGSWEWTARIEFKKYELGTSFSVLIFLGPVPDNPRELRTSPNYVGGHHAFVNSAANSCTNCRNRRDLVQEGFVHLNHGILKHLGHTASLEPDDIVPYLTKNLEWRVQKSNREVVELESLEVTVIATPLTYPPEAIFPVPGTPVHYNQITYGRPGGSRQP